MCRSGEGGGLVKSVNSHVAFLSHGWISRGFENLG